MVIVQDRQNLLDIAIQEEGNALAYFDYAISNGINPTDDLPVNVSLQKPDTKYIDIDFKIFYKAKNIKPVTALPLIIETEKTSIWGLPYSF